MAYYNPKIETKQIARELLDGLLPAWEASYEPGSVSDYLIGYANDEAAAKGAAIAWVQSQSDMDPATLEWVEMPVGDQHDHWFDLIQNHADGIPTDTGVNVRHRLPAAVRDAARQAAGQQKPTMAYDNGKGRVYCLNCASAVGADVALTVDVVDHWELCPSCGQHVVDVARQAAGQPAAECACGHAAHAPGDECEDSVQHGPKRWHRCLCLNRAGANMACPPDMDCQGGTLGYSDIWHKQRGYKVLTTVEPPAAGLAVPTNHNTETQAPLTAAERTFLTSALDEAEGRLDVRSDGFATQALALARLRRLAAGAES